MKKVIQILISPTKNQKLGFIIIIIGLVTPGLLLLTDGISIVKSERYTTEGYPLTQNLHITDNISVKIIGSSLGSSEISIIIEILNASSEDLSDMYFESILYNYADNSQLGILNNYSLNSQVIQIKYPLNYKAQFNVTLDLFVYLFSKSNKFAPISLIYECKLDINRPNTSIFFASIVYNILSVIVITLVLIYLQDLKYYYPSQNLEQILVSHQQIMKNYTQNNQNEGEEH